MSGNNNNNLVFNVPFTIECPNEESNKDMNDVIIRGKYHLPIGPDINNCNVLDIGGGHGSFAIWSLLSNSNKWKNQTIYIYEPNKDNYKILKQNMKKLSERLKFDVKTFNYAVSEKCNEDHIEGSGLRSYVAETIVDNSVHIPNNIDNNTEDNIGESSDKVVELDDVDEINKVIEDTIDESNESDKSDDIVGESFGGNVEPEKQIKLISCDRLPKADVVKINVNKGNYEILRGLIRSQKPIIVLVAFEDDTERSNIDRIMCYENSPYRLFDVDRKIIQKNAHKFELKGILKYIKM